MSVPFEPDDRITGPPPHPSPASNVLLDGLNDAQRAAVVHERGPALVLAGAGSGKTRVITHRIAWLTTARDVAPSEIVAVTFTNKAAAEMRERVERLLGADRTGTWIGTFHAMCLRILRRDGARIGLEPGFNIYDTDDQLAVVRGLLKEDAANGTVKARALLSRISRAKNAMQSADDLDRRAHTPDQRLTARMFARYDEILRRSNAVDFDDLLLRALTLFREHHDVLSLYAERCRHLLVDEYQDTNRPQYLLVRALASVHGNLFVVGDEDQSIYRFRGAEIRNILDFEHDHPGATTIRLEQNYRSTGTILDVAGAVISNNRKRKGKRLWTANDRGTPVALLRAPDDRAEAMWVAERVQELARGDVDHRHVAVLYRTNAQSRQFEEIFRRERIPFQLVGSIQFYERKEVKDLLAYLKLLANPSDDVSFRRAVNTPPRGVGAGTMRAIEELAARHGFPLLEATGHALEQSALSTRASRSLRGFANLISDLLRTAEQDSVEATLDTILERTRYEAYLEKTYPGQGHERMENVRSLISAAAEYWEEDTEPSLLGFLDRSALMSDADEVGRGEGVTLMTIHNAKGLEFPVVFLAGMEENLFPHARSVGSDDDIEEERRLCYVAMTRARRTLALSLASVRRIQGQWMPNLPSRFLDEIPSDLLRDVSPSIGSTWERTTAWGDRPKATSSAHRAAARAATPAHDASSSEPSASTGGSGGFRIGRQVRHPKFGVGEIVGLEGSGRALKLTIRFLDHGSKKILPSYTKLSVEA